jgi:hypothetical protein
MLFIQIYMTDIYFKGLVTLCHSFCLFWYFIMHTYIHIVHSSFTIRRGSSPSPHRWSQWSAQWEKPSWGTEPQSNSGLPNSKPAELPRTLYSGMTGRLDARIRKCQAGIRNAVTQNGMAKTWGGSARQTKYCGIHTLQVQGTKPSLSPYF